MGANSAFRACYISVARQYWWVCSSPHLQGTSQPSEEACIAVVRLAQKGARPADAVCAHSPVNLHLLYLSTMSHFLWGIALCWRINRSSSLYLHLHCWISMRSVTESWNFPVGLSLRGPVGNHSINTTFTGFLPSLPHSPLLHPRFLQLPLK